MITLTAHNAKAQILPDMGGGLAGLWADGRPIWRPHAQNGPQPAAAPFSLGRLCTDADGFRVATPALMGAGE